MSPAARFAAHDDGADQRIGLSADAAPGDVVEREVAERLGEQILCWQVRGGECGGEAVECRRAGRHFTQHCRSPPELDQSCRAALAATADLDLRTAGW